MNNEQPQSPEQFPGPKLIPPATESLLHSDLENSPWPESIRENPELKEQVEIRKNASESLSTIFEKIGRDNISLDQALESGIVTSQEATAALNNFTKLLESDTEAKRILLYTPFELIPATLRNEDPELQEAVHTFREKITDTWYELLNTEDVRANFVDGDMLEVELRSKPMERVVKAAHLIPYLVQKGILSISEVMSLIDMNPRTVIEKNIAETLPILRDLNLITEEKMVRALDLHQVELGREVEEISDDNITEGRARWLKQEEEKNARNKAAEQEAAEIISGALKPEDLDFNNVTTILAFQKAVESQKDKSRAQELYNNGKEHLIKALENKDPEIQDALSIAFAHIVNAGIADKEEIKTLGIYIPKLDGRFKSAEEAVTTEAAVLRHVIEGIEHDPELSQYLYPVSVMFGSRLKGYGTPTSDLDYAVFIKPETDFSLRGHIQKLLHTLAGDTTKGKAAEFWLEGTAENPVVKSFENADVSLVNSTGAHALFEGAWYGNDATIKELHEKLLAGYFYSEDSQARKMWLEEMERDTLQYRLLHKGYDRYNPRQKSIETMHDNLIDGASAFYDSGYRRLATKLYIEKVFLPKLKKQ